MVCTTHRNLAMSKKYKKSLRIKISRKKLGLDYVLKNMPAKFGDDKGILRQRK